ncbi:GNAT family N-acetyltransferase [Pseudomonas viridiflava]|nr:GNAT family N-acetyltransferase [Pseudomonas viridiflava]
MLKHADQNAPSEPRHCASADPAVPQLMSLRADHLPQAAGLSSALAWPYRELDWRFAFELGAGLAVEVEGQLVGTALWWPQGESHATVGMIIVSSTLQGKGIGRALMDSLLQHTGERTLMLNSTQEGLALYTRLGFVAHGRIHQHQALLEHTSHFVAQGAPVRFMQIEDQQSVRQLDRAATGRDRSALLNHLFEIGSILVVDHGDGVSAYGCVREWGRGVVIGPVVASGPEAVPDAKALIAALAEAHQGRFIRIDVTEDSGLSPWLSESGLPCVGHATPMVRTTHAPPGSAETDARLLALSNQSIG